MFKRGVTQRDAFARRALERERAHKGWWPFAYTLLGDIEKDYSAADEPLLERLYQSMAAGDGVYKITRRDRFPDLDRKLVDDCRERFPTDRPLVVHDVGCSSGISSLELFERLRKQRTVELHASDWYDRIYIVSIPGTVWTAVFDAAREPLQLVNRWLVLSPRRQTSWRYPVNRLVENRVCHRLVPLACTRLDRFLSEGGVVEGIRQVSLFHPRATRLAQEDDHFILRRHNLFDPNPVPCHIIRALNVLTVKHFTEDLVCAGIRSCLANLAPGGLLVLGRSIDEEDGRTRASAYCVRHGRLQEVWRINEGYERPDLAMRDTCL